MMKNRKIQKSIGRGKVCLPLNEMNTKNKASDIFTSFNSELNIIETECQIIYRNTIKSWQKHKQFLIFNS
jgi:hypothetical protein